MDIIIGRAAEQKQLAEILESGEAELVAVYGRRRVGKTYLIHNAYENQLIFALSGIHHATLENQLEHFTLCLPKLAGLPVEQPANWLQAFQLLQQLLGRKIKKHRSVIFFDEFPWLHTPRSGFLEAFENFWNSWASRQKNLIIVICGSAAAWMIQQVINNRGGLHNRVTRRMKILPFSIGETQQYLNYKKINLDRYQVLQLYMAMGGVPQYLREIRRGESAVQAIDRICFTTNGFLQDEFKNLFYSLFDNAAEHIRVITALAQTSRGLTRNEIIKTCKLTTGGGVTQLLEELTESGFISPSIPFGRALKDTIYKLTDEYSLFYIKFIGPGKIKGAGNWIRFATGSSWKSWSGYAFETICMKHVTQLKKALGIPAVYTETSIWRYHPLKGEQGTQIDLLIDRQDACINVCEMKFSNNDYEMTKSYAKDLQNKLAVFQKQTKTKKTLFLTMITTHGVSNENSFTGLIQANLTMDILFDN